MRTQNIAFVPSCPSAPFTTVHTLHVRGGVLNSDGDTKPLSLSYLLCLSWPFVPFHALHAFGFPFVPISLLCILRDKAGVLSSGGDTKNYTLPLAFRCIELGHKNLVFVSSCPFLAFVPFHTILPFLALHIRGGALLTLYTLLHPLMAFALFSTFCSLLCHFTLFAPFMPWV